MAEHISMSLIATIIMTASTIGGFALWLRREWHGNALQMMLGTGGGMLLAITLLEMLPHSMGHGDTRTVPLILLGFSSLFAIDLAGERRGGERARGMIGVYIGFCLHALLEGLSLMAGFQMHPSLGLSLLFALVLHKIPDSLAVASLVLATTRNRGLALLATVTLGVATLVGMAGLQLFHPVITEKVSQGVLAFTTGVFLYVSAGHLVPMVRQGGQTQAGICFFAAVVVYLLASLLLGGEVHPHA